MNYNLCSDGSNVNNNNNNNNNNDDDDNNFSNTILVYYNVFDFLYPPRLAYLRVEQYFSLLMLKYWKKKPNF